MKIQIITMRNGQKEVNKKKKPSILTMALFLALLDQPNYSGFNWKQYVEATIQYNAQQIYKQAIINIQRQKELEINSSEFQTIISRQNNQKLNINNDKISGAADLQMIGLNNLAIVEGIKSIVGNDAKVKFIAIEDDKTTLMCDSLNNQEFYINKENIFDRYYGETQKELIVQRIRCNGLVLGLNLPPIQHHFHYCRSTIMYLPPVERQVDIILDKKENIIINGIKILNNKDLNKINRIAFFKNLNRMEIVYKDFPILKDKDIKYKVVKLNDNSAMAVRPSKKGYVLEVNENTFNSNIKSFYEEGTKQNMNVKGTTYKDIGIHETGHMVAFEIIKKTNKGNLKTMRFDYNNNITTNNIVEKAFNNLKIYDRLQKEKNIKNISNYAITDSQETIGEAFADYYANKKKASKLSKEIIKIMKGMI